MNPQILAGQSLLIGLAGLDTDMTTQRALGSLSATISDYTSAYVCKAQPDTNMPFYCLIVPKAFPAAGAPNNTVTVTFHGTSLDGTALPVHTLDVDLVAPPVVPQATSIQVVPLTPSTQFNSLGVDPGSPTAILL